MNHVVAALTGATGILCGMRFVERLCRVDGINVHLFVSPWAAKVMKQETGKTATSWESSLPSSHVVVYDHADLSASLSSGSFRFDDTYRFVSYGKPSVPFPRSVEAVGAWMEDRNLLSGDMPYGRLVGASLVEALR